MRTSSRLNPSLATATALAVIAACGLLALACNSAAPPDTPSPGATASPTSADVNATPTGEASPDASGSPTGDVKKAEDALRQMVLQPEDVPEGLQAVNDSFTSNEEYIASNQDPDTARENVERWGRILSHETTYQPTSDAASGTSVRAITSTSSLYETTEGAALSFADGRKTIDETDWQTAHPELEQFREERIERDVPADELVWLRLSGVSTSLGGMVIEDLIIFRVGRQRGFLQVVSAAPGEDRTLNLDEVEGWLKAQVQAIKDALEPLSP